MSELDRYLRSLSSFVQERRPNPWTAEPIDLYRHPSGFRCYYIPKPGFHQRFFALALPYGSAYRHFRTGAGDLRAILPGSAHFLEHCIFERADEEGGQSEGLMQALAALGCQSNAYTGHEFTVYYVRGSGAPLAQAAQLLTRAFFLAELSSQRIAAELPIIQAELDMYADEPESRAWQRLFAALYKEQAVRHDIGGDREELAQLRAEDLQALHRSIYHPAQVQATVSGDWSAGDLKELLSFLEGILADVPSAPGHLVQEYERSFGQAPVHLEEEQNTGPEAVYWAQKKRVEQLPWLLDDLARARENISAQLLLDSLLGDSAPLYHELYQRGLINDSLQLRYQLERQYAHCTASLDREGAAEALAELRAELSAELGRLAAGQPRYFRPELYEEQRKAAFGRFVRAFDSVERQALELLHLSLDGLDLEVYARAYREANWKRGLEALSFLQEPVDSVELRLLAGRA